MTLEPLDINRRVEQNWLLFNPFLFYISKLLCVTVILYFLHSFSLSPRRRFVFQTEISGKYIVLVLISLLFYFFSSLRRGDQSTSFAKYLLILTDPGLQRSDTLLHWFVVVVLPILGDLLKKYLVNDQLKKKPEKSQ